MKNFKFKLTVLSLALLPVISYAQTRTQVRDLKGLAGVITDYIQIAIYLIISLAILMFVYNVYKYFISGSDDVSAKKEAGLYVMWSVIGFFVMLSFWGLVNILINSFKLESNMPSNTIFGNFRSSSNNTTNTIFNSGGGTRTDLGGVSNTGGSTNLGGVSNTGGATNLGGVSNNGDFSD